MNCPHCGASVPAGHAFCPECGRRAAPEPAAAPPGDAIQASFKAATKRGPNWLVIVGLVVLLGGGGVCVLAGGGGALYLLMRPTETPIPTATYTPTYTPTATWTPVPTATWTPTATPVPTSTPTRVPTRVPTRTPTQTSAPTKIPTATPVGQIYGDDFGSDTGEWYTGENEDQVIQIEDGRMSIRVKNKHILIRETALDNMTDITFSVMAFPQPGAPDAQYGLFCREEDDENYYVAGVSLYGQYDLYKRVDGEWEELISWTSSSAIRSDYNELRLTCVGSQITFYVNGKLLFNQTDDSFSRGGIGFYVATGDTPNAEVQFDDFVAREPEASDLPTAPTATPRPADPTATPRPAGATATPRPSWANSLYLDLVQTRSEYLTIKGWYETLYAGGSVKCPSQTYALHRPSYVIPPELAALRSIYDRYLAAAAMVDGTGAVIGPLDRIQLLCKEGKNIGQADMDFDMGKLRDAGPIFDGLIAEVSALR